MSGFLTFVLFGDAVVDAMTQAVVATADTQTMALEMLNRMTAMMALLALALVALGVVQWWRPSRIIPLFVIVIAVLGLFATLRGQLSIPPELKAAYGMPFWHTALNRIASTAELLLFIVGLRGAVILRRLRATDATAATA